MVILSILAAIIFGLIVFVICFVVSNSTTSETKNEDISIYNPVTIDELEFKIKNINYDESFSEVFLDVKNNGSKDIALKNIKLTFKDSNANVVGDLLLFNNGIITPGESKNLIASIDVDLSSSQSVEYELIEVNNNE